MRVILPCDTYSQNVFGVNVPEALHIVEYEPRERYDHQYDERNGNEQHGGLVDARIS